jgi:hypothetical protein
MMYFGPWYSYYTAEYYNKGYITHEDQSLINNRDPLIDNPFLIVYLFKPCKTGKEVTRQR